MEEEIVRSSNGWYQLSSKPQVNRRKDCQNKKRKESKEEAPEASTSMPQANQPPQEGKRNKKKNCKKPHSPGYSITIIQKDGIGNVFNMAITLMEFKDKEE
ncbi:hypothetical protein O181_007926 [Austropuccinia psidii MF-1]|uniref:Uncharacterized protein n=1 Tax=Austropuccinia psidii MF-1 TaxID=1389203 RepID=A0A9Q3BLQ7_9BASI|nr:hypothetical protein [Austropuccinia psidii MF-1]